MFSHLFSDLSSSYAFSTQCLFHFLTRTALCPLIFFIHYWWLRFALSFEPIKLFHVSKCSRLQIALLHVSFPPSAVFLSPFCNWVGPPHVKQWNVSSHQPLYGMVTWSHFLQEVEPRLQPAVTNLLPSINYCSTQKSAGNMFPFTNVCFVTWQLKYFMCCDTQGFYDWNYAFRNETTFILADT